MRHAQDTVTRFFLLTGILSTGNSIQSLKWVESFINWYYIWWSKLILLIFNFLIPRRSRALIFFYSHEEQPHEKLKVPISKEKDCIWQATDTPASSHHAPLAHRKWTYWPGGCYGERVERQRNKGHYEEESTGSLPGRDQAWLFVHKWD